MSFISVINILSPHVADMIAAGEVVERPASVIKELMENSFDAGAKNIIVEIKNGGATYIRVTDDGCGMAPEDVGIAFIRHATSKLHDESGLECISTMGFRGEALAAISSVSHIEIISREPISLVGTQLLLDAGEISEMSSFGCPPGTTVICRNLFFNTPARLKFLKSDRSESSACINTALRCALGHPDISIRFIRDGNEEFFTPGDGKLESAMYSLLGRDESISMLPCSANVDGLSLHGFISSPSDGRGNRAHQFFYINGRYIKSTLIQSALEQAYKNTLLSSRYPACILFIDLSYSAVDVNVHPTKTEVRFSSEKAIFDLVYNSVKLALENENRIFPTSPSYEVAEPSQSDFSAPAEVKPSGTHIQPMQYKQGGGRVSGASHVVDSFKSPSINYSSFDSSDFGQNQQMSQNFPVSPAFLDSGSNVVEKDVQNVENPVPLNYNILGEAFKTYIIIEHNGEIILIDKHAAHERMIFDRLKLQTREIESQYLLSPVTVHVSPEDAELIEKNGELLNELGFEIEPFGIDEFVIRSVPADMFESDVVASLEEICEKLRCGNAPDAASVRDDILHTVACKAAIKAGWVTQGEELKKIADAVISGKVKYCPHGRPVSITVTRNDLDKLFKRIL